MSSRSYYVPKPVYVPSPVERSRERIRLLRNQLEQADRLKQQLVSRMGAKAKSVRGERVQTQGFGEMALEALEGISVEEVATSATESNETKAVEVTGVIDYSEFFEADADREQMATMDAREYLQAAKSRASKLVALSSEERSTVARFIARMDELATRPGSAEDVRPFVEEGLESLCLRLGEDESERRADTYLDYLAFCQLAGETPKDLGFAEMLAAIERIKDELAMREFRANVAASLDEALGEVGLSSVGTYTLEEQAGRLVVDEEGGPCALFVSTTEEGAFVFTTVAATDPSQMSRDEQFAARESAKRLCSKKDRLLNEALARRGIETAVDYEYPPDLRFIEQSDAFAEYVAGQAATASGGRRRTSEGEIRAREAE